MHRKLYYFSLCLILILLHNVILAAHVPRTWLDLDDDDYKDEGTNMGSTTTAASDDVTTATNSKATDTTTGSTTKLASSSSTGATESASESSTDMASSNTSDAPPSETTTEEHKENLDPLAISCRRNFTLSEVEYNTTLTCYHCRSNTKTDVEPQCDSTFWRYTKYSVKAKFRQPCDTEKLRGRFCVKIIRRRYRERITERGCSTESIQRPNGQTLKAYNGCYSFNKDGFLTTVCFCDKSFCNGGQKPGTDLYLFILLNALVSVSMFM